MALNMAGSQPRAEGGWGQGQNPEAEAGKQGGGESPSGNSDARFGGWGPSLENQR